MSIVVQDVELYGENFKLLIVEPDWAVAPMVKYGLANQISESIDGYDYSIPTAWHLRLGFSWQMFLVDEELEQLETLFRELGDSRVIVPLWQDRKATESFTDERIHIGQINLEWTQLDYSDLCVSNESTGLDLVDGYACTALVGRLKFPETVRLDNRSMKGRLTVIEDSPIWARISPNSTNEEWLWPHDWIKGLSEQWQQHLLLSNIGMGREQTYDASGNARYSQKQKLNLKDHEIADFLSFFLNCQRGKGFEVAPPLPSNPIIPDIFSSEFTADCYYPWASSMLYFPASGMFYGNNFYGWALEGDAQGLITSRTLEHWENVNIDNYTEFGRLSLVNDSSELFVCAILEDYSGLVLLRTTNGVEWTEVLRVPDGGLYWGFYNCRPTVVYGDGLYVLSGFDEVFDALLAQSTDGVNWHIINKADNIFPTSGPLAAACYDASNNQFIVEQFGENWNDDDHLLTSADLQNWSVLDEVGYDEIVYNPHDGYLYRLGDWRDGYYGDGVYFSSNGGVSWSFINLNDISSRWYDSFELIYSAHDGAVVVICYDGSAFYIRNGEVLNVHISPADEIYAATTVQNPDTGQMYLIPELEYSTNKEIYTYPTL